MTWKPDVVLFHSHCADGFGAAFAAWKRYGDLEYIPCQYGEPAPLDRIAGKHVLMVDFSYKRAEMDVIGGMVKSMVVLDHHRTAQRELEPWACSLSAAQLGNVINLDGWETCVVKGRMPIIAIFDMKKSGARLAWEFCFPGETVPLMIGYIEDRDLWRYRYGDTTRRVLAALGSYDQTFEVWDRLFNEVVALEAEGEHILRAHQKTVENLIDNSYEDEIAGCRVPVLNVPGKFASDCGHALLEAFPEAPFAATWSRSSGGMLRYSLRSADDRMDVSEIAVKLGGGGHRNAAGFEIKVGEST